MKELKDLKLLEVSKLREMSSEDLVQEEKRASKELFTLTMRLKVGELKQNIQSLVLDWLAVGLDPNKSNFYERKRTKFIEKTNKIKCLHLSML